jgi:TRAP-type mannitol/chloroaromatic compound transport system permease small subunit
MGALASYIRFAEWVNEKVGQVVGWLSLVTVLVCFTVVVNRYVFRSGFVWMQELYVWTFGLSFMLGSGYAFLAGRHVSVDIFSARWSPKLKAKMEIFCSLVFLFPWLAVIGYYTWGYFLASVRLGETSQQVGGMPGLYVLKGAIMAFVVLMGMQGLANCARAILVLNDAEHLAPKREVAGLGAATTT